MKRMLPASLLVSPALVMATPAAAQDEAGDRVNMVIAYDESECPEAAAENEIVICEILVEAERYRVPAALRTSDSPQNRSWSRRVESIRYIGDFGTMSCSPVGAGGFTGCTQKMIDAAYKDRSEASNVRFAQLIEQARAERLSTIDVDAAAEQERVEQIEREYMERLERERQGTLPGETVDPTPPPIGPEAPESAVEEAAEGPPE
ncbi:hypothetical protein [Altererythrobacter sp. GH1-8]|uniref:hypothetical protein n=1 Tax=Altererythrobacter sp. GH1-8 TaxID=3349333 RepID=UPI00374DFAF2